MTQSTDPVEALREAGAPVDTMDDLRDWYDWAYARYFVPAGWEMPPVETIDYSRAYRSRVGSYNFHARVTSAGPNKHITLRDTNIRISFMARKDPQLLANVLLHEMIHHLQYTLYEKTGDRHYTDPRPAGRGQRKTHGAFFHRVMHAFNTYPELDIRVSEHIKDYNSLIDREALSVVVLQWRPLGPFGEVLAGPPRDHLFWARGHALGEADVARLRDDFATRYTGVQVEAVALYHGYNQEFRRGRRLARDSQLPSNMPGRKTPNRYYRQKAVEAMVEGLDPVARVIAEPRPRHPLGQMKTTEQLEAQLRNQGQENTHGSLIEAVHAVLGNHHNQNTLARFGLLRDDQRGSGGCWLLAGYDGRLSQGLIGLIRDGWQALSAPEEAVHRLAGAREAVEAAIALDEQTNDQDKPERVRALVNAQYSSWLEVGPERIDLAGWQHLLAVHAARQAGLSDPRTFVSTLKTWVEAFGPAVETAANTPAVYDAVRARRIEAIVDTLLRRDTELERTTPGRADMIKAVEAWMSDAHRPTPATAPRPSHQPVQHELGL